MDRQHLIRDHITVCAPARTRRAARLPARVRSYPCRSWHSDTHNRLAPCAPVCIAGCASLADIKAIRLELVKKDNAISIIVSALAAPGVRRPRVQGCACGWRVSVWSAQHAQASAQWRLMGCTCQDGHMRMDHACKQRRGALETHGHGLLGGPQSGARVCSSKGGVCERVHVSSQRHATARCLTSGPA